MARSPSDRTDTLPTDPAPKKRGRPAAGEQAMTSAERQSRYRVARARAANSGADPSTFSDTALLDRIRMAISDGSSAKTAGRYVRELSRRYP
ncbi:MAG: hypothetical protein GAK31_00295 [Stenotrophomonas maltophilia]|uniref:Uncharacterized protein n=1 Tax=Stenotrophomonas maltophilia TaxID=40324 RepID=A0A7V8JN60_STEMA|nr:MAG: hypothetical protein GAK31_00295 [Stenotrophomonas maltophilia]